MSKYFWMIQIVSLRINIRSIRANLSLSFQEWPAHLPNMLTASIKLPSKYTSLHTQISIHHLRNSFCSGCQVIQRLTSVRNAENENLWSTESWMGQQYPTPPKTQGPPPSRDEKRKRQRLGECYGIAVLHGSCELTAAMVNGTKLVQHRLGRACKDPVKAEKLLISNVCWRGRIGFLQP